MHCLLCHEKIPRLRAWRTKSEFCCDEHAALYKKQTLERLLVDHGPDVAQGADQSLLDISALAGDSQAELPPDGEAPGEEAGLAAGLPGEIVEGSLDEDAELERLTTQTAPPPAKTSPGGSTDLARAAPTQSAEEALEALRQLAEQAAGRSSDSPVKKLVTPMPPVSEQPPAASEESGDDAELFFEQVARETAEPVPSGGPGRKPASDAGDGGEPPPSLLDRLMEEGHAEAAAPKATIAVGAHDDEEQEAADTQALFDADDLAPPELDERLLASFDYESERARDVAGELSSLSASLSGSSRPEAGDDPAQKLPEFEDLALVERAAAEGPDELELLDIPNDDVETLPELADEETSKVVSFPGPSVDPSAAAEDSEEPPKPEVERTAAAEDTASSDERQAPAAADKEEPPPAKRERAPRPAPRLLPVTSMVAILPEGSALESDDGALDEWNRQASAARGRTVLEPETRLATVAGELDPQRIVQDLPVAVSIRLLVGEPASAPAARTEFEAPRAEPAEPAHAVIRPRPLVDSKAPDSSFAPAVGSSDHAVDLAPDAVEPADEDLGGLEPPWALELEPIEPTALFAEAVALQAEADPNRGRNGASQADVADEGVREGARVGEESRR